MDADGNNVERLTPSMSVYPPIVQPQYSPDGSLIAFGCHHGEQPHLCLMGKNGIYPTAPYSSVLFPAFPMEGGKTLSDICGAGVDSLAWAPDGQQVAFTCHRIQPEQGYQTCIVGLSGEVSCWPLSQVDSETGYFSTYMSWSPAGSELALSFQSKIYLTDVDGQNSRFLTEGENATWDPTGKKLLFFRPGEMLLIDRDGDNLQPLYTNPRSLTGVQDVDKTPFLANSAATWSPDGRFIAFVVAAEDISAIYRFNIRTGEFKRLTPKDDWRFGVPDWSP